jgi:hypothetical protein
MIDHNRTDKLGLKLAHALRIQVQLWQAHDRFQKIQGSDQIRAYERATAKFHSASRQLRSAFAHFTPDEQKRLWAEIDAKFAELKKRH